MNSLVQQLISAITALPGVHSNLERHTLTQKHQTALPRGIHHVADPNDPSTGAMVDDGGAAVESAVAAGAARTSRGAAITVAARVLTILLDILLPYNELYDVRVVGRAAELPGLGLRVRYVPNRLCDTRFATW